MTDPWRAGRLVLSRRALFAAAAVAAVSDVAPGAQASAPAALADDPLPSWNEGRNKQAILDFVAAATDEASDDFVPTPDRIATFDQDGTLWVEQPLYTQSVFALDRIRTLAPDHPDWETTQPFSAVLSGNEQAIAAFTGQDWGKIFGVTNTGLSVDAFLASAREWLATARHPRFDRRYTELVYQPMLEVMALLRGNGFRTYIVSGGGQQFIRSYAEAVYGIPPEQIIGTTFETAYEIGDDGVPVLMMQPVIQLNDDKAGKPEDIDLVIGRRPVAAVGNSTGDQQMLEWTGAGHRARLMMLVYHDDAAREYAYGPAGGLPNSAIGTFTDALMTEATARGWFVISMKDDWNRIFP
jgi:phosphoglycolate phosphatase-like HAD superfamily hydrolase